MASATLVSLSDCLRSSYEPDAECRTMVRVREFLCMGVRAVWVLDPDTRSLQVCIGATITSQQEGTLTVPETPITLAIADIFRILDHP